VVDKLLIKAELHLTATVMLAMEAMAEPTQVVVVAAVDHITAPADQESL
jgi:hypothetical protein